MDAVGELVYQGYTGDISYLDDRHEVVRARATIFFGPNAVTLQEKGEYLAAGKLSTKVTVIPYSRLLSASYFFE